MQNIKKKSNKIFPFLVQQILQKEEFENKLDKNQYEQELQRNEQENLSIQDRNYSATKRQLLEISSPQYKHDLLINNDDKYENNMNLKSPRIIMSNSPLISSPTRHQKQQATVSFFKVNTIEKKKIRKQHRDQQKQKIFNLFINHHSYQLKLFNFSEFSLFHNQEINNQQLDSLNISRILTPQIIKQFFRGKNKQLTNAFYFKNLLENSNEIVRQQIIKQQENNEQHFIKDFSLSKNGLMIAVASNENIKVLTAKIIPNLISFANNDKEVFQELYQVETDNYVKCVEFSHNCKIIIGCLENGCIVIIRIFYDIIKENKKSFLSFRIQHKVQKIAQFDGEKNNFNRAKFSKQDNFLAISGQNSQRQNIVALFYMQDFDNFNFEEYQINKQFICSNVMVDKENLQFLFSPANWSHCDILMYPCQEQEQELEVISNDTKEEAAQYLTLNMIGLKNNGITTTNNRYFNRNIELSQILIIDFLPLKLQQSANEGFLVIIEKYNVKFYKFILQGNQQTTDLLIHSKISSNFTKEISQFSQQIQEEDQVLQNSQQDQSDVIQEEQQNEIQLIPFNVKKFRLSKKTNKIDRIAFSQDGQFILIPQQIKLKFCQIELLNNQIHEVQSFTISDKTENFVFKKQKQSENQSEILNNKKYPLIKQVEEGELENDDGQKGKAEEQAATKIKSELIQQYFQNIRSCQLSPCLKFFYIIDGKEFEDLSSPCNMFRISNEKYQFLKQIQLFDGNLQQKYTISGNAQVIGCIESQSIQQIYKKQNYKITIEEKQFDQHINQIHIYQAKDNFSFNEFQTIELPKKTKCNSYINIKLFCLNHDGTILSLCTSTHAYFYTTRKNLETINENINNTQQSTNLNENRFKPMNISLDLGLYKKDLNSIPLEFQYVSFSNTIKQGDQQQFSCILQKKLKSNNKEKAKSLQISLPTEDDQQQIKQYIYIYQLRQKDKQLSSYFHKLQQYFNKTPQKLQNNSSENQQHLQFVLVQKIKIENSKQIQELYISPYSQFILYFALSINDYYNANQKFSKISLFEQKSNQYINSNKKSIVGQENIYLPILAYSNSETTIAIIAQIREEQKIAILDLNNNLSPLSFPLQNDSLHSNHSKFIKLSFSANDQYLISISNEQENCLVTFYDKLNLYKILNVFQIQFVDNPFIINALIEKNLNYLIFVEKQVNQKFRINMIKNINSLENLGNTDQIQFNNLIQNNFFHEVPLKIIQIFNEVKKNRNFPIEKYLNNLIHEINTYNFQYILTQNICNQDSSTEQEQALVRKQRSIINHMSDLFNLSIFNIFPQEASIFHFIAYTQDTDLANILLKYFKKRQIICILRNDIQNETCFDICMRKGNPKILKLFLNYYVTILSTYKFSSEQQFYYIINEAFKKSFTNIFEFSLKAEIGEIQELINLCFRVFRIENYDKKTFSMEFHLNKRKKDHFSISFFQKNSDIQLFGNKKSLREKIKNFALKHNDKSFQKKTKDKSKKIKSVIEPIRYAQILDIFNEQIDYLKVIQHQSEKNEYFIGKFHKAVILFYWNSFGKQKFYKELLVYISILVLLCFQNMYLLPNIIQSDKQNIEQISIHWNFSKIIFLVISGYCFYQTLTLILLEKYEIKALGFQKYYKSMWNMIDLISFSLIGLHSVQNFFYIYKNTDYTKWNFKVINSFTLFFAWIRLISFLRGQRRVSPFIRIIVYVVDDILYFMTILFCLLFGLSFGVHQLAEDFSSKNGVIKWWAITKASYRLLMGDFGDFDIEVQNQQLSNVVFFFFFIGTFFIFIIIMNLLISIISDTYEVIKSQEEQYIIIIQQISYILHIRADQYERTRLILTLWMRLSKKNQKEYMGMFQTVFFKFEEVDESDQKRQRKIIEKIKKDQSSFAQQIKQGLEDTNTNLKLFSDKILDKVKNLDEKFSIGNKRIYEGKQKQNNKSHNKIISNQTSRENSFVMQQNELNYQQSFKLDEKSLILPSTIEIPQFGKVFDLQTNFNIYFNNILYKNQTEIENELFSQRLNEILSFKSKGLAICNECHEEQAIFECVQCKNELFCQHCFDQQHELRNFKLAKHNIIILDDEYIAQKIKQKQQFQEKYTLLEGNQQILDFQNAPSNILKPISTKLFYKFEYFSLPILQQTVYYKSLEKIYQYFANFYMYENGISEKEINLEQFLFMESSLNSDSTKKYGNKYKDLRKIVNCKYLNIEDKLFLNKICYCIFRNFKNESSFNQFYSKCVVLQNGQFKDKLLLFLDLMEQDQQEEEQKNEQSEKKQKLICKQCQSIQNQQAKFNSICIKHCIHICKININAFQKFISALLIKDISKIKFNVNEAIINLVINKQFQITKYKAFKNILSNKYLEEFFYEMLQVKN